jgi:hypothetical protein
MWADEGYTFIRPFQEGIWQPYHRSKPMESQPPLS